MTSVESLISLTLRLQSLEAQIKGVPSSYAAETPSTRGKPQSIRRRVQGVSESLDNAGSESDALKRLVNGYESYKHLLNLPGLEHDLSSGNEDEAVKAGDVLPDHAKIAMLLEARSDIIFAERDLREIELLKQKGVEGSGDLEKLVELQAPLLEQMEITQEKDDEVKAVRRDVTDLLRRYNDFNGTVSDLFLDLHHRFERMEQEVLIAEQKKRKDLKGRY